MKTPDPEVPPPIPPPGPWACVGCYYGNRYVDWDDVKEEDEPDETWKGPRKKLVEGFMCAHPAMMTEGGYTAITGRLYCDLKRTDRPPLRK